MLLLKLSQPAGCSPRLSLNQFAAFTALVQLLALSCSHAKASAITSMRVYPFLHKLKKPVTHSAPVMYRNNLISTSMATVNPFPALSADKEANDQQNTQQGTTDQRRLGGSIYPSLQPH
jgi:hypothetical protein